jgi:hypothetical protein
MTPSVAYANTFILPSTAFTSNKDIHVSYYSRTDNVTSGYEIGASYDFNSGRLQLICRFSTTNLAYGGYGSFVTGPNTDSRGFFINNSNATNVQIIKNGNTLGTGTATLILSAYTTQTIFLGCENRSGLIIEFSTKQCAFASIGNGLTSSEVSLYTDIVERYQTTLNRQVIRPIFAVKSTIPITFHDESIKFFSAASITDINQRIAVDNLVRGLKLYDLWNKMIAIYPFVGGTASSHRFNLKDPRDANNAYRLSFSGGVTHSSTGVQPNGSNGWSNTFIQGNMLPSSNTHISYYSRTTGIVIALEMGFNTGGSELLGMYIRRSNNQSSGFYYNQGAQQSFINDNDGSGFYISTFSGTGQTGKIFRNAVLGGTLGTQTRVATSLEIYLFALNNGGPILYTSRQCAFASVGNGLTDAEVSIFNNLVQNYQSQLNRQV